MAGALLQEAREAGSPFAFAFAGREPDGAKGIHDLSQRVTKGPATPGPTRDALLFL